MFSFNFHCEGAAASTGLKRICNESETADTFFKNGNGCVEQRQGRLGDAFQLIFNGPISGFDFPSHNVSDASSLPRSLCRVCVAIRGMRPFLVPKNKSRLKAQMTVGKISAQLPISPIFLSILFLENIFSLHRPALLSCLNLCVLLSEGNGARSSLRRNRATRLFMSAVPSLCYSCRRHRSNNHILVHYAPAPDASLASNASRFVFALLLLWALASASLSSRIRWPVGGYRGELCTRRDDDTGS